MDRYFRKVLRITALDSPNVVYALKEIERGLQPSGYQVIPGVLPYEEYLHRRATWDVERATMGLSN